MIYENKGNLDLQKIASILKENNFDFLLKKKSIIVTSNSIKFDIVCDSKEIVFSPRTPLWFYFLFFSIITLLGSIYMWLYNGNYFIWTGGAIGGAIGALIGHLVYKFLPVVLKEKRKIMGAILKYNSKEKIIDDFSKFSDEKLLEIIDNKANYEAKVINVVLEILEERNKLPESYLENSDTIINSNNLNSMEINDNFAIKEKFLSIKGRIGRDQYFFRSFLLNLAFLPYFIFEDIIYNWNDFFLFLYLSILLLVYLLSFIQKIKRFHDFNTSGWHSLWTIIPFANFVFWFILIFRRGTNVPNKYGNLPLITKNFRT